MKYFLVIVSMLAALTNASHAQTYKGYDCTIDCSGHEAGYEWAEENDIEDEYDCSTPSNSFNEGCISYVEEEQESSNDYEENFEE